MRAAKGHLSTGWKNPVPHMTQRSVQLNKSPQSLYRVCARAGVGSGLPGADSTRAHSRGALVWNNHTWRPTQALSADDASARRSLPA